MSRESRPTRIPFSATNQKLQVEFVDPEFHDKYFSRWFNDQRGRIQRALNAGYEYVDAEEVIGLGGQDMQLNNDQGTRVSQVVTGPVDGNPEVVAYLMKLRREWWSEDQHVKVQRRKASENAVYAGNSAREAVKTLYGDITHDIKSTE